MGYGGKREGAGRPKGKVSAAKRDIAEKAKKHGEAALAVLVAIAQNEEEPAASRVSAANALLDRGYGKPIQAVSGPDGGDIPLGLTIGFRRAD